MIKENDINCNDIVLLWNEAFGDSKDEIVYFAENVNNAKCFVYYEAEKPTAMLYLVDCNINGVNSKYIYAACTSINYREKGYMTELLNYVKHSYRNICLIPAENWLIDYYKKRGFTDKIEINSINFNETEEITEYLFDGCELDEPFALLCKGD